MAESATAYYVVLHYTNGDQCRVGGPFIDYKTASGYAQAKERANGKVQAVVTGPVPKSDLEGPTDPPAYKGLVQRLRRMAGL